MGISILGHHLHGSKQAEYSAISAYQKFHLQIFTTIAEPAIMETLMFVNIVFSMEHFVGTAPISW
jgi:hypothetical protein